jgi:hypothetical protein
VTARAVLHAKPPMTLGQKQRLFARLVGLLLGEIYSRGYGVTFGEAYRSPEEAARLAEAGKGIRRSLHCDRLAIDLNLFHGDEYLTDTEAHRPFGTFWESMHPFAVWGGRFNDGNHYSLSHEGRR